MKSGAEPAGLSYGFEEAIVGKEKAYLAYKFMDGNAASFGGVAIWNEHIDGINQFLDIVDFLGINCYADSFDHNPVLGALFGLTGNRKWFLFLHYKYLPSNF